MCIRDRVGIDGVILTKLDGDTRGGAALSIKAVTGKPILYVGMGEKLSDLEPFYPERMASRMLGMGDVLSLIEKAEQEIDEEEALRMAAKVKKSEFDFNDYLSSMKPVSYTHLDVYKRQQMGQSRAGIQMYD